MPPFGLSRVGLGLKMDPSPGRDAFAVPISEPIFSIITYGQPPWEALFPADDVLYCVQYEAHYLLADNEA